MSWFQIIVRKLPLFILIYTVSLMGCSLSTAPRERSNANELNGRLYDQFQQGVQFFEILIVANYVRMVTIEHYTSEGKWATDISDINLQLSELYSEGQVRSIGLRHDGTIELDVSPTFGRNTTIWLIPEDGNRGTSSTWQCKTNVEIGDNIGSCKSF